MIHYDLWWNPAVEDQATDRAHRLGQLRCVHVHKLVCVVVLSASLYDLTRARAVIGNARKHGEVSLNSSLLATVTQTFGKLGRFNRYIGHLVLRDFCKSTHTQQHSIFIDLRDKIHTKFVRLISIK